MKGFISFIIAAITYIVLGLIAWNIVWSIIVEPLSTTIVELTDYRLCTYSAITFLLMCLLPQFSNSRIDDSYYGGILIYITINLGIAIATNHWEDMWENVSTIFTILYNAINVFFITCAIKGLFEKK